MEDIRIISVQQARLYDDRGARFLRINVVTDGDTVALELSDLTARALVNEIEKALPDRRA